MEKPVALSVCSGVFHVLRECLVQYNDYYNVIRIGITRTMGSWQHMKHEWDVVTTHEWNAVQNDEEWITSYFGQSSKNTYKLYILHFLRVLLDHV